jgi:hypothetical protein
MAKHQGRCHICGKHGRLTFEHIPPLAAGNERYGKSLDISRYLQTDPSAPLSSMRSSKQPRGSGAYVLCPSCNNLTGAWYVQDYATWVEQGERHRQALGATNSIALPFRIFPARVYKQIMSIFAATCRPEMFDANPLLRKLVLDKDTRGMPDGLRLYCYLVDRENRYSRHSGVAGVIVGSTIHTLAEFAYRPFGYILTFDGTVPPDAGLFELTFFAYHGYDDYRELHLPLPVRSVESYFPADFRSKDEWEAVNKDIGRL